MRTIFRGLLIALATVATAGPAEAAERTDVAFFVTSPDVKANACVDQGAYEQLSAAVKNRDALVSRLVRTGSCPFLEQNTRVRIVERSGEFVRFVVLDGFRRGARLVAPRQQVQPSAEVPVMRDPLADYMGALAAVRIAGARHAFGCFEAAALDRAVVSIASQDGDAFEMLVESGECVLVANGDRGQPQRVERGPAYTRVQMTSGRWIGWRLWFESDWLTPGTPASELERALGEDGVVSALAAASGQIPVCQTTEGLALLAALLAQATADLEPLVLQRAGCRLLPNGAVVTRSAQAPLGSTVAVRVTVAAGGAEVWTTEDMVVDFGRNARERAPRPAIRHTTTPEPRW